MSQEENEFGHEFGSFSSQHDLEQAYPILPQLTFKFTH